MHTRLKVSGVLKISEGRRIVTEKKTYCSRLSGNKRHRTTEEKTIIL
jgi:hypothetical protein